MKPPYSPEDLAAKARKDLDYSHLTAHFQPIAGSIVEQLARINQNQIPVKLTITATAEVDPACLKRNRFDHYFGLVELVLSQGHQTNLSNCFLIFWARDFFC